MTEQELIENGYSLVTTLGGYSFWNRGNYPEEVVLFPDGQARIAVWGKAHTNAGEMLRDLALKRVLNLVSQLPGVANYPDVVSELTAISNALVAYGDLL
jgi:hypothetical protein